MELTRQVDFDVWLRYVDALRSSNVPGYVTLDLRLAWRPLQNLELALVGQNLVDSHHPEFVPEELFLPTEVQRSVYGKITWRF